MPRTRPFLGLLPQPFPEEDSFAASVSKWRSCSGGCWLGAGFARSVLTWPLKIERHDPTNESIPERAFSW
jgi:hypothetical protein